MSPVLAWVFLAFVIEKLVEMVLQAVPALDVLKVTFIKVPLVLSLLFALVFTFGANLDFFLLFQIEFRWPYVGPIVSAMLMMGGSNLVHDILQWVEGKKQAAKAEVEKLRAS